MTTVQAVRVGAVLSFLTYGREQTGETLFRVLLATASQSEPPSLSRALRKQAFFKEFGIIKPLLDLFFSIAPDTEETPILVHFQRLKLALKIWYYDIVTPRRKRVVPFVIRGPLIVLHSVHFPPQRIDDTSCDERRNLIVFNAQWQRHMMSTCALDVYIICPMIA
jgi:hypothetical protein